jgi:hypothetical protein
MDVMGLDFGSEDNTDWSDLLTFLVKAAAQGQTIKAYAEWCTADPYNSPKKHQIAQKPLLVKQTWPSAFVKSVQPLQSVLIDSDGIPRPTNMTFNPKAYVKKADEVVANHKARKQWRDENKHLALPFFVEGLRGQVPDIFPRNSRWWGGLW